MAKRVSEAERVLAFFRNANIETAQMMFELVRGEMKRRQPAAKKATRARRPPEEIAPSILGREAA